MKITKLILLFTVLLMSIWNCSKNSSNEVIVYSTVDQIFSEPILKDFETQTGIKVKALFDTEETKSTGILNRLIAEKNNPQCDVFWSGDPIRAIILKNRGITLPYNSPQASDIEAHFKDKEFHWIGFSARARALIYNTNLVKSEDVPQSLFDLVKKKYKGQVAIANPLFGTTSFHFASWFSSLGDEKAKQLLTGFKDNQVVIATSNGDVKRRVVRGEVMYGLTDTDDVFVAKNEGAPVDYLFLDQDELGNLIIPNTVSMIKGSPNSENGKRLFDYLLYRETEAKLAVSSAQMPLHKGVSIPANIPSLDNILPMKINYDITAQKLEEIQGFLKSWVEDK
ncbi:iron ABC transporter substrate-binding protein [Candidatus Thiomargarita nelsonii]|uniref:Iron ABC transporter substrate-binding protein n=1 Tax=Candidatus Thiomargarita nelsonii TaxID=1003181 RepID=A0A4E0QPZ1_9GAMM|nr:iron ABC transporter substrate-binding protein [Candidatus Thiomargarita nelsonii]